MSRIIFLLALLLAATGAGRALAWSEAPTTPEGWAWAQIKAGQVADFNARCSGKPDPHSVAGWDNPCRQVAAQFVVDVLTVPRWSEQVGRHGLRLRGAHIVSSDLDLINTEIDAEVWLDASRIEGSLDLSDAHLKHHLSVYGSVLSKDFRARRLRVDGTLFMGHSDFVGEVDLRGATVGGDVDMETAKFWKALIADRLRVQNNLFMRGSSFGGDVVLGSATVSGYLEMEQSLFRGRVEAERLDVQGGAFMREASFEGPVYMTDAKVHVLDLRSSSATSVDLSGVTGDELLLTGLSWHCSGDPADASKPKQWPLGDPAWRREQCGGVQLNLHNTLFHRVIDSRDAWPATMDLAGFQYEEFSELTTRPATEWADWLARDQAPDRRSYAKLAAALTAADEESAAEAIQFAQREREREEAWVHNDRRGWLLLTAESLFTGYGIRFYYAGRVLGWVALLIILGAVILRFSPYARERGFLWQLGASLHRLLPIVQLDKEFKDFFDNALDNTAPRKLTRRQWGFFCIFSLAGWVLAALVAAIVSGLTPKK